MLHVAMDPLLPSVHECLWHLFIRFVSDWELLRFQKADQIGHPGSLPEFYSHGKLRIRLEGCVRFAACVH